MSRRKQFTGPNPEAHAVEALFGALARDPRARNLMSLVATWPAESAFRFRPHSEIPRYAKVYRWTGKYRDGIKRQYTEAKLAPGLEDLLDILVPALCNRDPSPFYAMARAIEALNGAAFPEHPVAFHALNLAAGLTGHAPPFNAVGEPVDAQPEDEPLPEVLTVPLSESEFRRKVERTSGQQTDAGSFHRLCKTLGIAFDPRPRQ